MKPITTQVMTFIPKDSYCRNDLNLSDQWFYYYFSNFLKSDYNTNILNINFKLLEENVKVWVSSTIVEEFANVSTNSNLDAIYEYLSTEEHPSRLSKVLCFIKLYLNEVIRLRDANIQNRINYNTYYNDFQELRQIVGSKINIKTTKLDLKPFEYMTRKFQTIDGQLNGSLFECVVADVINASYDWNEVKQMFENNLNQDSIKCIVNVARAYLLDYYVADNINVHEIIKILYSNDKSKFRSDFHFLLWKAFIHYIDKGDYENKIESVILFTQAYDEFKNKSKTLWSQYGFDEYRNKLKFELNLIFGKDITENVIHNYKYPKQSTEISNHILHYSGECDFMNKSAVDIIIYDCKSYKTVTSKELEAWAYQTALYSMQGKIINSVKDIEELFVIEGLGNNIYEFEFECENIPEP